MLTFEPLVPFALWCPLLLAAIAVVGVHLVSLRDRVAGRRRGTIITLMKISIALPLVVLLNPTWVVELPPPAGKPVVTILVDRSASMATEESEETRYYEAVRLARKYAENLTDRFEVETRVFDVTSEQVTSELLEGQLLESDATDLATVIEESLGENPQGQAIVLLSDGVHNAGGGATRVQDSVEKARAMAAPIYVQAIGGKANVKDLDVSLDLPQEMAFAGQTLPVRVRLRQRGAVAERVNITLSLDDEVVDEQEVSLVGADMVEAMLPVRQEESGLYRYEVSVAGQPGEVTTLNNKATLLVRVVDEPVKVLVLEGKPYWDSKFLLRLLSSDEAVELTSIIRLAPNRFVYREISRPVSEAADSETTESTREESWEILSNVEQTVADPEWLSEFQVVVLGRDAEVYLDDERVESVRRWLVEQNGALVCMRGSPSSTVSQRLGALMPVRWSPSREHRFRVALTESGESMPWLAFSENRIGSLPSLAAVARPERPKPLAVVLASAAGEEGNIEPVISYQPIGAGRVVVVEGAGMWRWAFLNESHQEHDEAYGRLWRSLIRWLVSSTGMLPSQKHSLRSDKVTFYPSEQSSATLLVRESESSQSPQVRLTGSTLETPQMFPASPAGDTPGQFRVVFGQLEEGQYNAQLVGADSEDLSGKTSFDVRGNLTERLNIASRPDLLGMIAKGSGGAVLDGGDPSQLTSLLKQQLADIFPPRVQRIPAWDRWWVLVGVLTLWVVSWGLRRRSGLI